jgi:hypothetical protein
MLKNVVKTPPLATVVALRSPATKGKVDEKIYSRSTSLSKFGAGATPETQTSTLLIKIPYEFSSICKAGSSILSYGLSGESSMG